MESLKRSRHVVAGAGVTRNVIGNLKRLNYVRDGSHMHACMREPSHTNLASDYIPGHASASWKKNPNRLKLSHNDVYEPSYVHSPCTNLLKFLSFFSVCLCLKFFFCSNGKKAKWKEASWGGWHTRLTRRTDRLTKRSPPHERVSRTELNLSCILSVGHPGTSTLQHRHRCCRRDIITVHYCYGSRSFFSIFLLQANCIPHLNL